MKTYHVFTRWVAQQPGSCAIVTQRQGTKICAGSVDGLTSIVILEIRLRDGSLPT